MPGSKYPGEAFSLTDLYKADNSIPDGYFYYSPKIVGVNFKSRGGFSRTNLIKDLIFYIDRVQLLPGKMTRDYIISLIKSGTLHERSDQVSKFIKLVSEPDNKFDSNAICVYVSNDIFGRSVNFYDIGYLPRKHAEEIKERRFQYFLIGAKPDGKGLRLDIILYEDCKSIPVPLPDSSKKESIPRVFSEFLTLKEMRKQLVV
jgi:hypothetical protein